jgi:hypothetical protein
MYHLIWDEHHKKNAGEYPTFAESEEKKKSILLSHSFSIAKNYHQKAYMCASFSMEIHTEPVTHTHTHKHTQPLTGHR